MPIKKVNWTAQTKSKRQKQKYEHYSIYMKLKNKQTWLIVEEHRIIATSLGRVLSWGHMGELSGVLHIFKMT
jgi:hypothetical protein